jgi:phosphatidylcholine synthase
MTNFSPTTPIAPVQAPSAWSRTLAWLVHAYTASGALAAFFGTLAAVNGRYRDSFLLMIAATLVDASDGVLARYGRVKEVLAGFDGARLDDIVDYLTFVFLPALLLYCAGDLPAGWGGLVASVVLLSSAYGFGSTDAKTSDHFFTGFPSYWNIVALYLHVARLAPWINAMILLALSVLVFVRIGYVYPSRTPVLRGLTIALCGIWGVMILLMIVMLPEVSRLLLLTSLFFPLYYVVLSLLLQRRRMRPA